MARQRPCSKGKPRGIPSFPSPVSLGLVRKCSGQQKEDAMCRGNDVTASMSYSQTTEDAHKGLKERMSTTGSPAGPYLQHDAQQLAIHTDLKHSDTNAETAIPAQGTSKAAQTLGSECQMKSPSSGINCSAEHNQQITTTAKPSF